MALKETTPYIVAAAAAGLLYSAYYLGRRSAESTNKESVVNTCGPYSLDALHGYGEETGAPKRKVLIITGASKGIGFATAELFLKQGWKVINISRSKCALEGVQNIAADFAQKGWESDVQKFFNDKFLLLVGKPDRICLIHNSGALIHDSSLNIDADEFRRILEVNLVAPVILNRIVSPHMPKTSSILYIGSTLSEKGVPQCASYVSSKHAVAGMMKVTCQDLKGRDIHTVCVCPGFTATDMVKTHLGANPEVRKDILALQIMGRLIEPKEVASVNLFCAENPSTNGAVFHCNLGQVEK